MRHAVSRFSLIAALALTPGLALAASTAADKIVASAPYKSAVSALDADHDRIVSEIVTLVEIPAPPFKEAERAKAYMAMLKDAGLTDVEMDEEGNVMGVRKGTAGGPKLTVIAAHLDTVFPEGTPIKVKREGTKLSAPGIGDDTRSLAVLLGYIRAMDKAGIKTKNDILFVGNVGEEGPGDLRGVRYLFTKGKYKDRIGNFISMDGTDPTRVVNGGVGSKRYKVTFNGPGGHSYGAFGLVNPMTAMSQAVTDLYKIQLPTKPRVTYSASVTGGGTSVNSIPNSVWMEFDMRSESPEELDKLHKQFLAIIPAVVEGENAARSTRAGKISADIKPIGDRPGGSTSADTALVKGAQDAIRAHGMTPELQFSSTDANMPMSLGIPGITIGSGGTAGRAHALDEWIDVEKGASLKGMSIGLAILLSAAEQ